MRGVSGITHLTQALFKVGLCNGAIQNEHHYTTFTYSHSSIMLPWWVILRAYWSSRSKRDTNICPFVQTLICPCYFPHCYLKGGSTMPPVLLCVLTITVHHLCSFCLSRLSSDVAAAECSSSKPCEYVQQQFLYGIKSKGHMALTVEWSETAEWEWVVVSRAALQA